ncbi:Phosphatidylinositol-specific phospholipase C, Y domain protein, partial [Teladorsagia circumcincta]
QPPEEPCGSLVSENSFDSLSQMYPDRKLSIPLQNASELALLAEEVVERQLCPEKEEHSTSDLSKIVNYLSADKVPNTWNVERRFFLMCSMSEDASIKIYKDSAQRQANNLIKHTSKRLVRVFPANMRITSDNFLPNIHWMMGVQMVALNFQTNCSEMLMNHAMFEQTANCGYVKKPDCLCDPSLDFDFYSSRVPYRMRVTLKITVISALFLPVERNSENSPYHVTLDLFDLPQQEQTVTSYRISSTDAAGTHTHFKPKQVIFDKDTGM